MSLREKLEKLEATNLQDLALYLNKLVADNAATEFAEWVRITLEDSEKELVGQLKVLMEGNERVWIALGRLQMVEALKNRIFIQFTIPEEPKND